LFRKRTRYCARVLLYTMELLQEQQSQLGMKNRKLLKPGRNMVIYDLLNSRNKRLQQTFQTEKTKKQND